MGQRGPKPGMGGRPKKAIAEKIADGNPGKRKLTVIDFRDSAADLKGQIIPKPSEFLSARQIFVLQKFIKQHGSGLPKEAVPLLFLHSF